MVRGLRWKRDVTGLAVSATGTVLIRATSTVAVAIAIAIMVAAVVVVAVSVCGMVTGHTHTAFNIHARGRSQICQPCIALIVIARARGGALQG